MLTSNLTQRIKWWNDELDTTMHLLNVIFLHGKNDFTEGSKILLDTDLKIILSKTLKIMSNSANNFDILATNLKILQLVTKRFLIILIVQQNYFSDLYPAKIWDLSAKSFFLCRFEKILIIMTCVHSREYEKIYTIFYFIYSF